MDANLQLVEELKQIKGSRPAIAPKDVVNWARRNKSSILYARFQEAKMWDDASAAAIARLQFARQIIQRFRFRIIGNDERPHVVRAFVSTTESRGTEASYRFREDVKSTERGVHEMQADCAAEIETVVRRYPDILSGAEIGMLRGIAERLRAASSATRKEHRTQKGVRATDPAKKPARPAAAV